MKIKSISVYEINIPYITPFIITYSNAAEKRTIIVKVETDTGLIGYGEAAPDPFVTGETVESTYYMLKHNLAPILIGKNPLQIERIHEVMGKIVSHAPSAKAAIDIACYDLLGKYANLPIYQLLGGKYYESLEIPFVLSIKEPEVMANEAKRQVEKGYRIIKIKVGTDLVKDIERVKAIREKVGPAIKLRVDSNQGWKNRANTINVLRALEDVDIDWIEQPVVDKDIQGLADIRRQTHFPIMIDEGLHGEKDLREVIEKNSVDYINIKLMKCGGIYPALKLIHQAELAGIQCQIGSMVETSVATVAGAHVSISRKNVVSNELVGPLMIKKDIGNMTFRDQSIELSVQAGLGIDIDEEALRAMISRESIIA